MASLTISDDMREANNVEAMADAFNPAQMYQYPHERRSHPYRVVDAIEAALLYGAGRISKNDFLFAVGELGEWTEHDD